MLQCRCGSSRNPIVLSQVRFLCDTCPVQQIGWLCLVVAFLSGLPPYLSCLLSCDLSCYLSLILEDEESVAQERACLPYEKKREERVVDMGEAVGDSVWISSLLLVRGVRGVRALRFKELFSSTQ